jgi:hypothetical protein
MVMDSSLMAARQIITDLQKSLSRTSRDPPRQTEFNREIKNLTTKVKQDLVAESLLEANSASKVDAGRQEIHFLVVSKLRGE